MGRNYTSVALLFLCMLLLGGAQSPERKPKPKRPKPSRPPTTCPDTCALKRRIGKVEMRFRAELDSLSAKVEELESPALNASNKPISPDVISMEDVSREITRNVDEKLDIAIETMRGQMESQYDQLKDALRQVNQHSRVMSEEEHSSPEAENTVFDLRVTINVLNYTLLALRRQNENLLQQTQEIRSQTSVLRAQNEALADDNEKLRQLAYEQKAQAADKDRIIDVEDKLSEHGTTISTLSSKIEWLTSRLEQLTDVADRAQTEAASAADKANRATAVARKAISIARRQPAAKNDGEDAEPEPRGLRQPAVPPNDCWELMTMGYNESGVYRIRPQRSPAVFEVFCEQSYAGGGWTVIQRRRDGSVNFDRTWNEYSAGFGTPDGEMWLGNQNMYYLTNQDTYAMQVLLLDWEGNRAYAEYEGFRVHGNTDNHAIQFGRYVRGNAGDALRGTLRDGSRNAYLAHFTTRDMDNDSCQPCMADQNAFENCAGLHSGGWWYRACTDSNLNGRYILPQDFGACGDMCYGVQWRTWRGDPNYSLKASIMMIRRIGE